MDQKVKILILGGGFGGVATAQELSKIFKRQENIEITLVNRDNYFVFVPMLASAAAGSIEPMHAVVPTRHLIPKINFRAEEVTNIDLIHKQVTTLTHTSGHEHTTLTYDHLVIALGNVVDLSKLPGVAEHGMALKTLGDAIAIRNHIIQLFEAADNETDQKARCEMLSFVVAGGGFSGVEMVGELRDMINDILKHFPSINQDEVQVKLLHSRDRILPEMSESTGRYVLEKLKKMGVEIILNTRLASATAHEAVLKNGQKIPTRTLIVAVGNASPPVISSLDVEKLRGKIIVNPNMQVSGYTDVWALGDNAIVPNAASENKEPSPPTAQYAIRQGKTLARNIAKQIQGQELKPFAYNGLGLLCTIGDGKGVGELLFGIKIKGWPGWFMWRGVYWAKLPSLLRKLQVGFDWFLDLFMERELAYLNLSRTQVINRAHFEQGEIIFRQGDLGDHFYMIIEGEIEVIRENTTEAIVLAVLGKGECFGETALLNGGKRNATIRCKTDVDVITLNHDDFTILTNTWQQLALNLQQVSEQRSANQKKYS